MNKWIMIAVVVVVGFILWTKFGSKIKSSVRSVVPGA